MHWTDRYVHTLIYSHIWVAGAATALGWQTLILNHHAPACDGLTIYLFSGTMMAYSLQRWFGMSVLSDHRQNLIGPVRQWWPWMVAISGIAALTSFFQLSPSAKWVGLLAGMLSIVYIVPINTHQRIRDIPGLKIFLISIVWALATVILPLAQVTDPADFFQTGALFCSRALFIFAITLPFDLRDEEADSRHRTLTLPLLLGWEKCLKIGLIALGCSILIDSLSLIQGWINWYGWWGNSLTILLASWMLFRTNRNRSERFFGLWMDGLMFLPWLITSLIQTLITGS